MSRLPIFLLAILFAVSAQPAIAQDKNAEKTLFLSQLDEHDVKVELHWFRKNGKVELQPVSHDLAPIYRAC